MSNATTVPTGAQVFAALSILIRCEADLPDGHEATMALRAAIASRDADTIHDAVRDARDELGDLCLECGADLLDPAREAFCSPRCERSYAYDTDPYYTEA